MFRFRGKVDVSSEIFAFPWAGRRVLPNVRPDWSDLLGERFSGKFLNDPLARGFFYVWADKLGTCREEDGSPCEESNYKPAWTTPSLQPEGALWASGSEVVPGEELPSEARSSPCVERHEAPVRRRERDGGQEGRDRAHLQEHHREVPAGNAKSRFRVVRREGRRRLLRASTAYAREDGFHATKHLFKKRKRTPAYQPPETQRAERKEQRSKRINYHPSLSESDRRGLVVDPTWMSGASTPGCVTCSQTSPWYARVCFADRRNFVRVFPNRFLVCKGLVW